MYIIKKMIQVLLVVLIALWFLGYIDISMFPIPPIPIFSINGMMVSLWDLLILGVVAGLLGIIPSPMKQIVAVLLVLWVLVELAIIKISGIDLDNILIIAIIVGVAASIFTPKSNNTTT
jgi:hypothetical protein